MNEGMKNNLYSLKSETARLCGCTPTMVNLVLTGLRNPDTELAKKIKLTYEFLKKNRQVNEELKADLKKKLSES